MVATRLGKRYAKSLLDLSKELGKVEEVKADIEKIREVLDGSREFKIFIKSPIVKPDKKISVFKELFKDSLSTLSMQFLEIITKKGRESDLEAIAEGFLNLYRVDNGISKAVVTTAVSLSDAEREDIRKQLVAITGGSIEIEEKVNPNIIGGMTLRVGDKQYNGSIAYQLQALKRQFKDNLYVPEF